MKIGLLCGREYSFPPAFLDRVNTLGRPHGISAEFLKLTGTKMGEPSGYRVIVDRISHEVEYFRGALKHAVLQGSYVINNPFWWTADDKFFNYSVMGVCSCRTACDILRVDFVVRPDTRPAGRRTGMDAPFDRRIRAGVDGA